MKSVLSLLAYLLWINFLQSFPVSEKEDDVRRKQIKVISKLGEEYVEQEVRKALTGMKQMKDIVEINEQKHENIIKSLKTTTEEKLEAARLLEDINQRTNEAEEHCKERLLNAWYECQACRERPCIMFYITNCSQQDFQSFSATDQYVFEERSLLKLFLNNVEEKTITEGDNVDPEQVTQTESSFHLMVSDVHSLFNQSLVFFKRICHEFDQSFQKFFMAKINLPDPDVRTSLPDTDSDSMSHDFFNKWDVSRLFQSFYGFSQAIFDGFSSVVSRIFKDFTEESQNNSSPLEGSAQHTEDNIPKTNTMKCKELQNISGCMEFQERCQQCYETLLKECPDVLELYAKAEKAFKLVNLSAEQYDDLIQIIQQHTEDTSNLINEMKETFGWVAELANLTSGSDNIFSIEKVSFSPKSSYASINETFVEVNIFTSPTFTVRVPGDVDLESPKFIQYVADEALQYYKTNF